jgi:hypothetical protein
MVPEFVAPEAVTALIPQALVPLVVIEPVFVAVE